MTKRDCRFAISNCRFHELPRLPGQTEAEADRAALFPLDTRRSTLGAANDNYRQDYYGNGMNPYYNLPPEQRVTQRLVDQFNADERLWEKLAPRRKARRKLRPRVSRKKLKKLDLSEFAKARPPQECVGQWIEP